MQNESYSLYVSSLPSPIPFVLQGFFTLLRGYKSARSMQRSGCTVARRVSLLPRHYQRYRRRFWVVISSNPSNGVVYLNFYTALAARSLSLSLSVHYLYAIIVFTSSTIEIHTLRSNDDQSNLSTIKIVHLSIGRLLPSIETWARKIYIYINKYNEFCGGFRRIA